MKILSIFSKYLSKRSKTFILISGILFVIFLSIIDYYSGYEIAFSIFYLLPISMVGWFSDFLSPVFISILSALAWGIADVGSGHFYSHFAIPIWNTIMRFFIFIIVSYFLTNIKKRLYLEKEMARTDSLTKIGNARYFYEILNNEINRALRYKHPVTLAYLDIDNFKQVNDNYGHSKGDALLFLMAQTIKQNIRVTDTVARLGGDEFAILLPETGEEQAKIAINKIYKSLQNNIKTNSVSIGVITFNIPHYTADEMIKMADNFMYSVKNSGKNMIKYEVKM